MIEKEKYASAILKESRTALEQLTAGRSITSKQQEVTKRVHEAAIAYRKSTKRAIKKIQRSQKLHQEAIDAQNAALDATEDAQIIMESRLSLSKPFNIIRAKKIAEDADKKAKEAIKVDGEYDLRAYQAFMQVNSYEMILNNAIVEFHAVCRGF